MAITTSIKSPSQLQFVTFPVFSLAWYASPPGNQNSCTAFAYCGGGGSARTGVNNAVQIEISTVEGKRVVRIDTGDDVGVGVALHQADAFLWVLIAIGDGIRFYVLPVVGEQKLNAEGEEETTQASTANLIAQRTVGEKYGANSVDFSSMGDYFAVGCENGMLSVFSIVSQGSQDNVTIMKFVELDGHIKTICTVKFHPKNSMILATSAKDGTCRVWDLLAKQCLYVLSCKAYDKYKKTPVNPIIRDPKPGQLLVRGCAFGDLDGQTIYTVQSGRRSEAFLSIWKLLPFNTPTEPDKLQKLFQEVNRICIAPYPVSAMSLSGDFSTIAFGDTNGTVTLLSTETLKPVKSWVSVHDLPVTCIAARPLPLEFWGENLTGVMVDALSASADNKLLYLTKQYKSTLKTVRVGAVHSRSVYFYCVSALLILSIAFIVRVSFDACRVDLMEHGDLQLIQKCVVHTVLWAPITRPGVSEVPL